MPARKPQDLKVRHDTKSEIADREEAEASLTPDRDLPMKAPARLDGHEIAGATWRRLMRTYRQLDARVVTALDLDLLVDYCLVAEQALEIDAMRKAAYQVWQTVREAFEALDKNAGVEQRLDLALKLQAAQKDAMGLDARADQKRKLLLQLRQSLYMTPRARAGAAPEKKEKPQPKDDLELLLEEAGGR